MGSLLWQRRGNDVFKQESQSRNTEAVGSEGSNHYELGASL